MPVSTEPTCINANRTDSTRTDLRARRGSPISLFCSAQLS
jgi:hypothetical protein